MIESFAEYAISHEAGHAVVGQFVKIAAPHSISFQLKCGADGRLCLGDFSTTFPFPPDDQIAQLPQAVKNCLCYTLAAGFAATQFSGLSLPDENDGLVADRERLGKLTSNSLDSFVPNALAIIKQEERAFKELISQCIQKYEQLKTENVSEGRQVLLDANGLETLLKRAMTPRYAPFRTAENDSKFHDMMSAHEAGHAVSGITLGARVEAVYALPSTLPSGKVRLLYLTKFGSFERAGLALRDWILLTASGAAAEALLNKNWDEECVGRDRTELEDRGIVNFDYCVDIATQLLQENIGLLIAVRDKIRMSMLDLRECKVTRKGTHIILAKGSEIDKLFRTLGFRVSSSTLDLDVARVKDSGKTGA